MHLRLVHEDPTESLPKLLPYEKVVVFVRHGESTANVAYKQNVFRKQTAADEVPLHIKLRDSELTDRGIQQALSLQRKWVSNSKPQLILSSPLTRALQTSCLAFEKNSLPIVAWPILTEFFPECPECQGRTREKLEADQNLAKLSKWPDVHLENVVGDWWNISGDMGRLDVFLSWLRWCPETRIIIVCHWGFITNLMEYAGYAQRWHLRLDNCAQLRTVWHPEALPSNIPGVLGETRPPREYAIWLEPDRGTTPPFIAEYDRFCMKVKQDPILSKCAFISRRGGRFHIALSSFLPLPFDLVQRLGMAFRTQTLQLLGRTRGKSYSEYLHAWHVKPGDLRCSIQEERSVYAGIQFENAALKELCEELSVIPGLIEHAASIKTDGTFTATLIDGLQNREIQMSSFSDILVPEKFPLLCTMLNVTKDEGRGWQEQISSIKWFLCLMQRTETEDGITVQREPGMAVPLFHI